MIARLALSALCLAGPVQAADPIAGGWVTEEGDAVIEVGQCGRSVCGRIARFLVPPPDGLDQRDVNNPDPDLRRRKLLGLPVLYAFTEEEDLWRGRIYDPKSGKSYRSVIRRRGRDRLEVKGCVTFICQTQVWQRAR